jgi:GT2 family glycosyltransferase
MNHPAGSAVLAVVVTYNSVAEIESCLHSLQAQRGVRLDLRVIDNGSTDGTVDRVRALAPAASLTVNASNVGFGRANNQVLLGEPAPWVALVNPDATVPPDTLAVCVAELERDPRLAAVGVRHRFADGRPQPSAFPFLNLRNLWGEALGLHPLLAQVGAAPRQIPGFDPDRPADVDWIQGSFMVLRGEPVRRAGGFDPGFFMYGEDMELCWRLRREGWGIRYLPAPVIEHVGGASGRPVAPRLFVEDLRSKLRFFARHRGGAAVLAARLALAQSIIGRWGVREAQGILCRLLRRPVPEALAARLLLFRAALGWLAAGQPFDNTSS